MTTSRDDAERPIDYFGVLDILAIAAEWWKVLVGGTMLAAILTVAWFQIKPDTFVATALVSLTEKQRVLLTESIPFGLINKGQGDNQNRPGPSTTLPNRFSISKLSKDVIGQFEETFPADLQIYRLAVSSDMIGTAKGELEWLLEQLGRASLPDPSEIEALNDQAKALEHYIEGFDAVWQALVKEPSLVSNSPGRGSETDLYGRTIIDLLNEIDNLRNELRLVRSRIKGFNSADVFQKPVETVSPVAPKVLMAVLLSSGLAFAILFTVAFLHELWQRAKQTPEGREKVRRITHAIWLAGTS